MRLIIPHVLIPWFHIFDVYLLQLSHFVANVCKKRSQKLADFPIVKSALQESTFCALTRKLLKIARYCKNKKKLVFFLRFQWRWSQANRTTLKFLWDYLYIYKLQRRRKPGVTKSWPAGHLWPNLGGPRDLQWKNKLVSKKKNNMPDMPRFAPFGCHFWRTRNPFLDSGASHL